MLLQPPFPVSAFDFPLFILCSRSPSGAGFRLGASAFPATSFLGCSVRLPVAASLFPCYAVCLLLLLGLRILLHFAASLFSRCLVLVKHSCFSVVRFAASMFTRCSSAFRISIS
jgi:hypothetical protein